MTPERADRSSAVKRGRSGYLGAAVHPLKQEEVVNAVPLNAKPLHSYLPPRERKNPKADVHCAPAGWEGEVRSEEPAAAASPVVGERRSDFTRLERAVSGSADCDRYLSWVHPQCDAARKEREGAESGHGYPRSSWRFSPGLMVTSGYDGHYRAE